MSNISFISWLKEIEIKDINEKYKKEIIDFNFLKEKYFLKNSFLINEKELNKSLDFLDKSFKDMKKNNKNLLKEEELILKLKYYLNDLNEIRNFFDEKNMTYNKLWKYKILYFMFGSFIYLKNFLSEKEISNSKKFSFFSNKKKVIWYAFENGPITNHYSYRGDDDEIEISFNYEDEKIKNILEKFYLILKKFGIKTLIDQSHKTNPWKEVYENSNQKLWLIIETDRIIDYFKYNAPFFIGNLKNE